VTYRYEWNPMPHEVAVACPECGKEAVFESAMWVGIARRKDVPFFKEEPPVRVLPPAGANRVLPLRGLLPPSARARHRTDPRPARGLIAAGLGPAEVLDPVPKRQARHHRLPLRPAAQTQPGLAHGGLLPGGYPRPHALGLQPGPRTSAPRTATAASNTGSPWT
jgi:hypothetical protein